MERPLDFSEFSVAVQSRSLGREVDLFDVYYSYHHVAPRQYKTMCDVVDFIMLNLNLMMSKSNSVFVQCNHS